MDGIVDSNSGPGYLNPGRATGAQPDPVTLVLDEGAGISAELDLAVIEGRLCVVMAVHDPERAEGDDDEVYALALAPDRARAFGTQLVAMARAAGLRRAGGRS